MSPPSQFMELNSPIALCLLLFAKLEFLLPAFNFLHFSLFQADPEPFLRQSLQNLCSVGLVDDDGDPILLFKVSRHFSPKF